MLRPDNLDTAGRKNTEVVALAVEVTAEMTEFLHRVVATEGATGTDWTLVKRESET